MTEQRNIAVPHRRWNPLLGEWVVVSPHRMVRPWQGQVEQNAAEAIPAYDPKCYLCPGNTRAGGAVTPKYDNTYVFENDYAALMPDTPEFDSDLGGAGLMHSTSERGLCRVICFSPDHSLTMASMTGESITQVVELWAAQEAELASRPEIGYVEIFENRGAMMGCSNPHPHGQIWATEHVPNAPARELVQQREYHAQHGRPLLSDYLRLELAERERIVAENSEWVALIPYWAVWPFEVMLVPRAPSATLTELAPVQRKGLAAMLKTVTAGYNRVFDAPFPYSMGFHNAPADGQPHPEWVLHAHFFPPLLRSATVRKFMVGFELLGSPQRDITPESAAETLRKAFSS
jgi:UDPglucose--hexose-1-phosphate uridylyltransferase